MAANSVEIANNALIRIGANTITALSDSTKEARACNARYNPARKAVLRSYPWNFAKKRDTLSTAVGSPGDFGYEFDFAVPSDFLRIITLDTGNADYRLEQGKILTDASTVDLLYVFDITDTTKFDPMFDEALGLYLAWSVCFHLTQSNELRKVIWDEYYAMMRISRFVNATENPTGLVQATQWIEARNGPNNGFVRDPGT
jgi:hypothetical protein